MKIKKNVMVLIAFLLVFFISNQNVNAANICTSSKYDDLKKKTASIEAKWDLKFDDSNNSYFEITFDNVDDDVMLLFMGAYYEPKNNKIQLDNMFEGGTTYQFKFYAGYDNPCVEEYLYTKSLKVPVYNKYSEMDECKENSEWELCDKWYDGYIQDEEDFRNKLDEYLHSDEKKEVIINQKNNETKKKIIIFSSIVLIIVILIICFTKKKKNKNRKKVLKGEYKNEKK